MSLRIVLVVALLAAASCQLVAAPAAALTATTWDEAQALSREHGRPILIDFFTEW